MAVHETGISGFQRLLTKHPEWLISLPDGSLFPVLSRELRVTDSDEGIRLEFPTDFGMMNISPVSFAIDGDAVNIRFQTESEMEDAQLSLVPRIKSDQVRVELQEARLFRAGRLARVLESMDDPLRPKRFDFSSDGGRLVTIHCEDRWRRATKVMADVSDSLSPEYMLAAALLDLEKAPRKAQTIKDSIAIVLPKSAARSLAGLTKLIRRVLRDAITVYEFIETDEFAKLIKLSGPPAARKTAVPKYKPIKSVTRPSKKIDEMLSSVTALSPSAIDTVFTSSGWTLRYHGLPFLRLRSVNDSPRCWIGIGKSRKEIPQSNVMVSAEELLSTIAEYRRHDPPTKQHEYYKLASEAWLESLLVREVTRVDPNLVIAPLYNQFRTGSDRIDIFALRSDGRVVIIEVKTSSDREAVLQSVDYWRKIESARLGNVNLIEELFHGRAVVSKPPIIYIVAPLLSFHRDFEQLIGCIDPSVPICRFDLNEDWRKGVRVQRRTEY